MHFTEANITTIIVALIGLVSTLTAGWWQRGKGKTKPETQITLANASDNVTRSLLEALQLSADRIVALTESEERQRVIAETWREKFNRLSDTKTGSALVASDIAQALAEKK